MKKIILIALLITMSACSSYNPLYDPKSSKDGGKNYYSDMQDCEHIIKKNSIRSLKKYIIHLILLDVFFVTGQDSL